MVAVLAEREHVVEQRTERELGVAGLLGRRAAERRAQRAGVAVADRRQRVEPSRWSTILSTTR